MAGKAMAKTDGQIDWPIGWEVDGKHVLQVAIQHEDALPRSKVPHSPTCIQTTAGERDKTQLDDAWLPVCNTSTNTVSAHSNIAIKKSKKRFWSAVSMFATKGETLQQILIFEEKTLPGLHYGSPLISTL